ncbi:IS3 family transposase [Cyanobium sp. BSA11S]|uniref:IS3 family transposase n=1 Tax=Cyanobium sp. BSA11S TaxID=3108224 RepID=UPI003D81BE3B
MRFRLIDELADRHSVAWLCRQLGVARSGFYAWRQRQEAPGKRAAENARLTAEIEAVFREHRGFYGSPRIHQELRAAGHPIGRHRVARLMRRADLRARTRKPFRPCSKGSGGAAGVVENLLQQEFAPPAPNRCWAGDITYIRTSAGWRYLAVWIDLFSRRVVGWKLDRRMDAALVIEALNRALGHRQVEPEKLLLHTDQGSTGPPTTAICSENRRSSAACPPKDAAGTTPWWRASSPPSSWSWTSMTIERS